MLFSSVGLPGVLLFWIGGKRSSDAITLSRFSSRAFRVGSACQELIVVHNLRNTLDLKEATELFWGQVMQCYDGEASHLGGLNFTACRQDAPPVHHIGLCYEFSEAGDKFNAKNRDLLLQSILPCLKFCFRAGGNS